MTKTAITFRMLFAFIILFSSCKVMNKSLVNETNIPSDIGNKSYKILFAALNFDNTVSDHVAKVNNNSAEKYFQKNFKGIGEFINESDLNNKRYSDTNIFRYALMNKVSKLLKKIYTSSGISSTTPVSS